MKTLEEAWQWYTALKEGLDRLTHLAKYWDALPWDTGADWVKRVERDNTLGATSAADMAADAEVVRDHLDDIAVFVLFSVFEAIVRDLVVRTVRPEVEQLRHPALRSVGMDFLAGLAERSFFQVLEPFKSAQTNNAIEKVNKVRRYRNWVADGRHGNNPTDHVYPVNTYDWLRVFIKIARGSEPQVSPLPPKDDPT